MSRRPVLLVALLLAGPAVSPAHAASVGYCPAGSVAGFVRYGSPLVTMTAATVSYQLNVNMNCTGTAPANGNFILQVTGMTTESCESGATANGTIVGRRGNDQITSGSTGYTKSGVHYFSSRPVYAGAFTIGTQAYEIDMWLDRGQYHDGGTITPDTACPHSFTYLVGHAIIRAL